MMNVEHSRIQELEREVAMLRETLRDIYLEVAHGEGSDSPGRIIELGHWDIVEEVEASR
jgi:uncharacterized protein (UPF0335 family)